MDMSYLEGRSFYSHTTGVKNDNGDWEVTVNMSETLAYPNGTTRQEYLESTITDKDFDVAHKTAMKNVLQDLENLVYSRGFDSLIEALDYERNLEGTNDLEAKPDETAQSE